MRESVHETSERLSIASKAMRDILEYFQRSTESNQKLSHIAVEQVMMSEATVWKDSFPVSESQDYVKDDGSADSIYVTFNDEQATPESQDPFDLVQQEIHAFGDTGDRPPVIKKIVDWKRDKWKRFWQNASPHLVLMDTILMYWRRKLGRLETR